MPHRVSVSLRIVTGRLVFGQRFSGLAFCHCSFCIVVRAGFGDAVDLERESSAFTFKSPMKVVWMAFGTVLSSVSFEV